MGEKESFLKLISWIKFLETFSFGYSQVPRKAFAEPNSFAMKTDLLICPYEPESVNKRVSRWHGVLSTSGKHEPVISWLWRSAFQECQISPCQQWSLVLLRASTQRLSGGILSSASAGAWGTGLYDAGGPEDSVALWCMFGFGASEEWLALSDQQWAPLNPWYSSCSVLCSAAPQPQLIPAYMAAGCQTLLTFTASFNIS